MIKYLGFYYYKHYNIVTSTLMLKFGDRGFDIIAYCSENRITKDSGFDTTIFLAGCVDRNIKEINKNEIYKI